MSHRLVVLFLRRDTRDTIPYLLEKDQDAVGPTRSLGLIMCFHRATAPILFGDVRGGRHRAARRERGARSFQTPAHARQYLHGWARPRVLERHVLPRTPRRPCGRAAQKSTWFPFPPSTRAIVSKLHVSSAHGQRRFFVFFPEYDLLGASEIYSPLGSLRK